MATAMSECYSEEGRYMAVYSWHVRLLQVFLICEMLRYARCRAINVVAADAVALLFLNYRYY